MPAPAGAGAPSSRAARAISPELRSSWSAIEALESVEGCEAASLASYRPAETHAEPDPAHLPITVFSSTRSVEFEPAPRPPDAPSAPHASSAEPPARRAVEVEGFDVVERIGQGGMGVVYRAVQRSLGREVALKRSSSPGDRASAQFVAEAQITGRLDHANIVPVHLLSRSPDGTPQLAMKLVRGTSWRELLHSQKGEKLELRDHLRILLAVCNAVAFAHERGVIHRDLKPDNVMVGEFGQVFVMDWGLAVPLERAKALRSPAGTPSYMAPELAAGDGAAQDARTDVYLLGACLHEVVTRRRRHEGPTVFTVLASALESPPFAYDAAVPAELAAIANCACAADPVERFQSTPEMRRALEAFLEHREAHAIIEKGRALLGDLGIALAGFDELPDGAREGRSREVDRLHAEIRFAFRHALEVWKGADAARAGLREASRALLEHALATEDAALAGRVLSECEDESAAARVADLRERLAARERELVSLRDAARRHDWSAIADPLGTVFLAAGALGAAGAALSKYALLHRDVHALYHPRWPWIALCVLIGGYAFVKLRGARVPDSLVSPRVLGTWAAVAIGCALTGIHADLIAHAEPFRNACYQAWMIAIGFTAMGFERLRWLLAPALAFFLGGCVMAVWPDHNPEVFGAIWFAVFTGVGVALRTSARERGSPDGPGPLEDSERERARRAQRPSGVTETAPAAPPFPPKSRS